MKKKKIISGSKRAILLGILLLCLAGTMEAQTISRERNISRNFRADENFTIEVSSKYGNIHLNPWDKDSVRFDVFVKIKGSKQSKVDKIYSEIDFEFTATKYYVIARTKFGETQNSLWSDITEATETIFSSGDNVEIDYTISFPREAAMKIGHKFGNIYTTDHPGKLEINLSNGDLKAFRLSGPSTIGIKFGTAVIDQVTSARLTTDYAEVDIRLAQELSLNSRSSKINIENSGKLTLVSRRDKINIQNVGSLNMDNSFSYLTMGSLSDDLTVTAKYGEIKLENVKKDFQLINLNTEYTDVYLTLPRDLSAGFQMKRNSKTTLNVPKKIQDIKEELVDKENLIYEREGNLGASSDDRPRIKLNLRSGTFTVTEK